MLKARAADEKREDKYSAESQFRREVEILGVVRHPNIVALLGHCSGDGVSRQCLVFEYMAGASLRHRLKPPDLENSDAPQSLSWRQRLSVAADVANGLAFLHEEAGVVHQGVKPDNILLSNLQRGAGAFMGLGSAKLADFFCARNIGRMQDLRDAGRTHISTRNIVGTSPCMAPEYVQSGHVRTPPARSPQ